MTKNKTTKPEQNAPATSISLIAIVIAIVALFMSIDNRQMLSSGVVANAGPEAFFEASAKDAGIRGRTFEACYTSDQTAQLVREDINEAFAAGGAGTPFNVIITPEGQQIPISGAQPYELFNAVFSLLDEGAEETLTDIFAQIDPDSAGVPTLGENAIRPFDPATDHYRGSENPRYTLVEYSDFECPFCARAHQTFKRLVAERDDVTWVYRHLPLESIHPNAEPAARASECIAQESGNDAFWEFADTIFEDTSVLQK
jgi:protein-disulfide isomerase